MATRNLPSTPRRNSNVFTIGMIVAGLAIVVGLYFLWSSLQNSGSSADQREPSNVDGYAVVVGDSGADHTVRIYEDMQCPVCAQFEAATAEDLKAGIEAGTVKVEYRVVSFLDSASDNDYSSRAANAAIAVLETGGVEAFEAFHDTAFATQPAEGGPGPDDEALIAMAVDAGAEETDVRPLIEDKVFESWLQDATDQMSKDGVTGTPTVFIDGEKIEGSPADAVSAVQALL